MHESKFSKKEIGIVGILRILCMYNEWKGITFGWRLFAVWLCRFRCWAIFASKEAGKKAQQLSKPEIHTQQKETENPILTSANMNEITAKMENEFVSKSGIFCALNIIALCNAVLFFTLHSHICAENFVFFVLSFIIVFPLLLLVAVLSICSVSLFCILYSLRFMHGVFFHLSSTSLSSVRSPLDLNTAMPYTLCEWTSVTTENARIVYLWFLLWAALFIHIFFLFYPTVYSIGVLTIIVNFVDGVHNGLEFIRNIVNALNNKITKSNEEKKTHWQTNEKRQRKRGRTECSLSVLSIAATKKNDEQIQKAHCNMISGIHKTIKYWSIVSNSILGM